MKRNIHFFIPTPRRRRDRRRKEARPVFWPLAILIGYTSACLSDEAPMVSEENAPLEVGDEAAGAGPTVRALPPGGLVNTDLDSSWTEGVFAVNGSGGAEYHLPLWVPTGRGLTPELALHYNSNAGNGLVGVGWTLTGFSSITPCPTTLAHDGFVSNPDFVADDAFCLDGQRLREVFPPLGNQRQFATERDDISRIAANPAGNGVPESFTVQTKDRRTLIYGAKLLAYKLTGTQPENPAFARSPSRVIAAWALNRIEDRQGNSITIEYNLSEDESPADMWAADMVPIAINYSPNRRVELVYDSRPDPIDAFHPGRTGSVHTRSDGRLVTIKIYSGAALQRTYNLSYLDDISVTGRSRLTKIVESDSEGVSKRPLEFEWSTGSWGFTDIDTALNVGFPLESGERFFVGDINGDGLDDLLYGNQDNEWRTRLSNGIIFGAEANPGIPRPFGSDYIPVIRPIDYDRDGKLDILAEVPANGTTSKFALYRSTGTGYQLIPNMDNSEIGGDMGVYSAFFADIDGNGVPDYLAPRLDAGDFLWRYRLNTGSGFAPIVTTDVVTPSPNDPHDSSHQIRSVSLDGQHMYLVVWNEPQGRYEAIRGDLSLAFPYLNLPFRKQPENASRLSLHFADINGDGIEDAVYPYRGLTAQLGSGAGFSQILPGPTAYRNPLLPVGRDLAVRIADFNGDGADDVLLLHPGIPASIDDFAHGLQLYMWRDGHFVRQALGVGLAVGVNNPQPVQPLDFDGDGLVDIALATIREGRRTLHVLRRHGDMPDKLIRIRSKHTNTTNPPQVEIDYGTLASDVHVPGTDCVYPTFCPGRGSNIVVRHRVRNGVSDGLNEYSHSYVGARVDVRGRGWLGFAEHAVAGPGFRTRVTKFDNVSSRTLTTPLGEIATVYPFAHLPKEVTYTAADPFVSLYRRTVTNSYELRRGVYPRPQDSYQVVLTNRSDNDEERRGVAWKPLQSVTTAVLYDEFLNATRVTTTTADSTTTIDRTFRNESNATWLIGLLETQATKDCATAPPACETRTVGFDHDAAGNISEVIVEPDHDDVLLRTTIARGEFGNVTSVAVADALGEERTTGITYDSLALYPRTTTNALGQTTTTIFHSGLGVVTDVTAANGVTSSMKYDRFGQLREVNYADGYFERYTVHSFSRLTYVPNNAGEAFLRDYTYFDFLGRPTTSTYRGFDGTFNSVDRAYDALGRVVSLSRPRAAAEDPPAFSTFEYDARDRLTKMAEPTDHGDGFRTTRFEYLGLESHTYDAEGNHSYVGKRSDGLIESSYEDDPKSTAWLTTTFEYQPFGQVGKETAPDGTIQAAEYDRLGRRILQVDPSSGTTAMRYNAFGEVVEEVNNAGTVTTFEHDLLGRTTRVSSPRGDTTYAWDIVTRGIGQIGRTESEDGVTTSRAFDDFGRAVTSTWSIDGTAYSVDATFDSIGRLSNITYPAIPGVTSRVKVAYAYNPSGYLYAVSDENTGDRYWRLDSRTPAGQLGKETFGGTGNGPGVLEIGRGYFVRSGMPYSVSVRKPNQGLMEFQTHQYDLNKNVTFVTSTVGVDQRFTYDSLNRLAQWRFGPPDTGVVTAFDYDRMGNLLSETVTGQTGRNATYQYGQNGAPAHALTTRNGQVYTYDDAGRQITSAGRTMTYNVRDLPIQITQDGQTTDLLYDAAGTRVLKRGPDETSISIAGLFERQVRSGGVENHHYVLADGRIVAHVVKSQATPTGPITATEVRFMQTDHQGSLLHTYYPNGDLRGTQYHDPFGRRTDKNYNYLPPARWSIRLGFTGHMQDDELGLIDMKGRIYDPVARRFPTPDPFQQSVFSQGLNRYTYVRNNPVTFTDPTGFEPEECPDGFCPDPVLLPPVDSGSVQDAVAWVSNVWDDSSSESHGAVLGYLAGGLGGALVGAIACSIFSCGGDDGADSSDGDDQTDPGRASVVNGTQGAVSPIPGASGFFGGGRFRSRAGAGGSFDVPYPPGCLDAACMASAEHIYDVLTTERYLNTLTREERDIFTDSWTRHWLEMRWQEESVRSGWFGFAGPVRGAVAGVATIFSHNGPHFTIAVKVGDRLVHTEQLVLAGKGTTIAPVLKVAPQVRPPIEVPLPDAAAAIRYLENVLLRPMGPYNVMSNSCVTHCGNVLRAGGVDVPDGTRAIIRWLLKLGAD